MRKSRHTTVDHRQHLWSFTFFLYGRDSERYALISHIAGSLLEVSPWWPLATMHST